MEFRKSKPLFTSRKLNLFLMLGTWVTLLNGSGALAGHREDAIQIAATGLKRNIAPVHSRSTGRIHQYLTAGAHQYHSLWAWDFAFASLGAIRVGDQEAVKDTLELYFGFQRADGLLPRGLDNRSIKTRVFLGLVGFVPEVGEPWIPQFRSENHVISPIPNIILPWAASRYIQATGDREFATRWWNTAKSALEWIKRERLDGHVIGKQEPFSDWMDSVSRTGKVGFTNVLYAMALRSLADWADFNQDLPSASTYRAEFEAFREKFREEFWIPERKILRNFEGDDRLSADVNLLAVAYEIVNREDSISILNTLRESPLWHPMPGRPTWPNYPKTMKSSFPRLAGLAGYHDQIYWLWLTALAAIAEGSVGNESEREKILKSLSEQIIKDGQVEEVLDFDGGRLVPVKRCFYRSEAPFTWSSGLFLEAALR